MEIFLSHMLLTSVIGLTFIIERGWPCAGTG